MGTAYDVVQFHLHWGATDAAGGEHTIDGEAYPMEVRKYKCYVSYIYCSSQKTIDKIKFTTLISMLKTEKTLLTAYYLKPIRAIL